MSMFQGIKIKILHSLEDLVKLIAIIKEQSAELWCLGINSMIEFLQQSYRIVLDNHDA